MITVRLLLLLAFSGCVLGARILAFLPFPAKSHHIAFQPMLRELAVRGHEVDYVTAVPLSNPPKTLKHIMVKDLLAELHGQISMKQMMEVSVPTNIALISGLVLYTHKKLFEEDPEIMKIVNSKEKYDAVILETHFGQEHATALCHKFKSRCISVVPLLDSAWVNEMSGLPDNPSYMVDFKGGSTDRMSFLEKLRNVYIWTVSTVIGYYFTYFTQQEFADKYIRYDGWETRPSVLTMTKDMDLILVNSHVSLTYPYPKAPHVKEVGGMSLAPNKPLPKDLQEYMDSATKGVIYFSYGSNVDMNEMMKGGTFDAFVNTFKKLPLKVLWKWKGSDIPKVDATNIRIQQWFPQQDILAHKNVKLFITHGGLMSMIEAISNGVPLIGTAVFGDQPKNIRFVEHVGIGIDLKFGNLTETSISWAINEILQNPSYKNQIMKRSAIFKDRLMKPVDEAVYWIEYVLKHGKVLQPRSVRMPFYQVYLLDVIGAISAALLLSVYIIRRILRALCKLCSGKSNTAVSVPKSKKKQ